MNGLIVRSSSLALALALIVMPAFPEGDGPEASASAVQIDRVEWKIENLPSEFLSAKDRGRNVICASFFIYMKGLKGIDDVTSASVRDPDGIGWDIDLKRYWNEKSSMIGGYERLYRSSLDSGGKTVFPLGHYLVKVVLKDGTALRKDIVLTGPNGVYIEKRPFLYTSSYRDIVTPFHVKALEPPIVTRAVEERDEVTVSFTISDKRAANAILIIRDEKEISIWSSIMLVSGEDGQSSEFLNGGAPFLRDGRVNTIRIAKKRMGLKPGKKEGNWHSCSIQVFDGLQFRGSASPLQYSSISMSASLPFEGKALAPAIAAAPENPIEGPGGKAPGELRRRWLLRLSGVLASINSDSFDDLNRKPDKAEDMESSKTVLRSYWDDVDREQVIQDVESLMEKGNDWNWQRCLAALKANPGLTESEVASLKEYGDLRPERLELARRYGIGEGVSTLKGFDLCRAINLIRWGYGAEYLTAEESWVWLEKIGKAVEKAFDSWESYGKNYVIGRMFWNGVQEEDDVKMFSESQEAYVKLLSKGGAWRGERWEGKK